MNMKTLQLPRFGKKQIAISLGVVLVLLMAPAFYRKTVRVSPLAVVSTVPADKTTHNPYQPVTITFNRSPKESEYSVSFSPPVEFIVSSGGDPSIRLTPKTNFDERTRYTVTVSTAPAYVFTFETEQLASNIPGWNEQFDKALDAYDKKYGLQNRALTNIRKTSPVKQDGFVVRYSYDDNYYSVTLSPPYQQNKDAFFRWFTSLGVTDLSLVPLRFINQ